MWKISEDKCFEELQKTIRSIDKSEIEEIGYSLEEMISFIKKLDCNVYSIYNKNNKLLAIGGVNEENGAGIPFLFSTSYVEDEPIRFCKEVKNLAKNYFKKYNYMVNLVHKDNKVAIKWLKWLGFDITNETHGNLIKFERFNDV